jgi:hypothetical protein
VNTQTLGEIIENRPLKGEQIIMHTRGIILEGYSNAGKTSTLKAIKLLQAQDILAERSVVILSEHYTQICNRVNGEIKFLNRDEHQKLLEERISMVEKLSKWAESLGPDSREPRGLFFVFERFHLNHKAAFHDFRSKELEIIETDLLELGAKTVLLTISPEIVEQRVMSRRPKEWVNRSREELKFACNQLLEAQDQLRIHMRSSVVPSFEINTDQKDWNDYALRILKLLMD